MALTEAQKAQRASAAATRGKKKTKKQAAAEAPAAAVAASEVAAPTIDKSKKVAGGAQSTVFVASKITRGLYLDIFQPTEQTRRVVGGGIERFTQQMRLPERVRIKPAVLGFGLIPAYPIVEGFSITRNVPASHWRKWVEQNPNYEPYTMGLIRAFDTEADAIAYAREHGKLRTGLEPLAQDKDPRVGTSNHQNVGDVEIDDETPRPKNVA